MNKVVARSLKKKTNAGEAQTEVCCRNHLRNCSLEKIIRRNSRSKRTFDRDNLWRMFSVWAVLRGYPIPDWRQLEGTPERKKKRSF
jgi:16S rRNA (cytosine967-C5)-methyltransferase